MFKKKIRCSCGKNIDKNFDYCPYCGNSLKPGKAREQQFRNFERELDKELKMPFIVKFPFKQLMKQFEKQIDAQVREMDKSLEKDMREGKIENRDLMPRVSGLSISISSDGEGKPIIKVGQLGKPPRIMNPEEMAEETAEKITKENMKKGREIKGTPHMSEARARKFSKLPRAEPETKVRRLTDKVVYEIALPGVKSVKDIVVNKLDNSIEIKAFSKDKAYFKLIPISLPIKKYSLSEEKLILELIP